MTQKIGLEAILNMTGFNKGMGQYTSGIDQMETKTSTFGSKLKGFAGALGTGIAGAAAIGGAAIVGVGAALGKLAVEAAPLEGIGMAFETMSAKAGLSLDALREASRGTVSDFDLMRNANIALSGAGEQLGQEFGKNLPKLMEIAQAAARATGQDAEFLFNSLVTGVKRTSPMLIDNTGLQLKLGEANEKLAKQLGKSVDELTAEERQIALLNATLEAGQVMVDDFGGGQLTASEQMAKFKAQIQNTKDQIGLAMLPALNALMQPLGDLAQRIGPLVVEWAKKAGEWLGQNLPIFIEQARLAFVAIVAWVQENWPKIKEVVTTVMNAIKAVIGTVLGWIQSIWGQHGDEITSKASGVWNQIKETVGAALEFIKTLVETVMGIVRGIWERHGDKLTQIWKLVWDNVKVIFETAWAVLEQVFIALTALLKGDWEAFGTALRTIWETVWSAIQQVWDNVKQYLILGWEILKTEAIRIWGEIKSWLEGVQDAIWDKIEEIWADITNWVVEHMEHMLKVIKQTWEDIRDKLTGIWETLREVGTSVWEAIRTKIESLIAPIKSAVQKLADAFAPVLGAIGGILDLANAAISAIQQLFNLKNKAGVNSIGFGTLAPSLPLAPVPGTVTMPSPGEMTGRTQTVNITLGPITVSDQIDLAAFQQQIVQTVQRAIGG